MTTKQVYKAPTLTHYGKLADLTQAGSVFVISADLTGDGKPDSVYAINGDLRQGVIVSVPQADDSVKNYTVNYGFFDMPPTPPTFDTFDAIYYYGNEINGFFNTELVIQDTSANGSIDSVSNVGNYGLWDLRDGQEDFN